MQADRCSNLKLGINASRARSGGGLAHLKGILAEADPEAAGFAEVHVWCHQKLADALPRQLWLRVHSPPELENSIARQLMWEHFSLPGEVRRQGCTVLLNVDAGSVCRFKPAVTMSRDMLSYEPGEIERYGFSVGRLRLFALRYVQNAALRSTDGAVFLTAYAGRVIQDSCGQLPNVAYIPHGVSAAFKSARRLNAWPAEGERPIRCLYVSNVLPYKHQWHVVEAVARLRSRGIDIELELVGGGQGAAQDHLDRQIALSDPQGAFVTQYDFVSQDGLVDFLQQADLFVFASSCENMPNTLVEAMAAGLPIACSDRGPMPEVLEDGGLYFDPESVEEMTAAIERMILEPDLRERLAAQAKELSAQYSWARCARETFAFAAQTAERAGAVQSSAT